MAKLINVSAGVNGTIILTSDKYRFDLYINLFLIVVTVSTNAYFIPKYGIEGAAMATALALFIHNMVKTLILYLFYKIQPFQVATFKLVAIGVTTFFLVSIIPDDVIEITWLRILLRSLLITSLFTFAVIVLSISEDVNVFYKKCVRYFK